MTSNKNLGTFYQLIENNLKKQEDPSIPLGTLFNLKDYSHLKRRRAFWESKVFNSASFCSPHWSWGLQVHIRALFISCYC